MREHGAASDEWPELYEHVQAAHILVVGTPICSGSRRSALADRAPYACSDPSERGQYAYYGSGRLPRHGQRGRGQALLDEHPHSLQHLRHVVLPQADAGWIGDAGLAVPRRGLGRARERLHELNTTFMTWNLLPLARMLVDAGSSAHGNQRSLWDEVRVRLQTLPERRAAVLYNSAVSGSPIPAPGLRDGRRLGGRPFEPRRVARRPEPRGPGCRRRAGRRPARSRSRTRSSGISGTGPTMPRRRYERAQVLAWQFFEQYSHEPYVAVAFRNRPSRGVRRPERLQSSSRGAAAPPESPPRGGARAAWSVAGDLARARPVGRAARAGAPSRLLGAGSRRSRVLLAASSRRIGPQSRRGDRLEEVLHQPRLRAHEHVDALDGAGCGFSRVRRVGALVDVLELVEDDERPIGTAVGVQPQRRSEGEQRAEGPQRSELGVELQPRAVAERTEREADAARGSSILEPDCAPSGAGRRRARAARRRRQRDDR